MRESISPDTTLANPETMSSSQSAYLGAPFSPVLLWLTWPGEFRVSRMDLFEDAESQTITACLELPGLKLTDLEIRLDDSKLTVSGKRPAPGTRYPIQELKYGAFQRSVDLPIGIKVGTYPRLVALNDLDYSAKPNIRVHVRWHPHPLVAKGPTDVTACSARR